MYVRRTLGHSFLGAFAARSGAPRDSNHLNGSGSSSRGVTFDRGGRRRRKWRTRSISRGRGQLLVKREIGRKFCRRVQPVESDSEKGREREREKGERKEGRERVAYSKESRRRSLARSLTTERCRSLAFIASRRGSRTVHSVGVCRASVSSECTPRPWVSGADVGAPLPPSFRRAIEQGQ